MKNVSENNFAPYSKHLFLSLLCVALWFLVRGISG